MPDSHLSTAPQPPQIVTSGKERRQAGVGLLYADDYNANLQNQYNNQYNYWLWQQQMAYNSPAAQVQRLLDAGLNPNFNSIEGTGNAGSIPASNASLPGKIGQNHLNAISTGVGIATALATGVSKGVSALKAIASTPASIRVYRRFLRDALGYSNAGRLLDNELKTMENLERSYLNGYDWESDMSKTIFGRMAEGKLQSLTESINLTKKRSAYQELLNTMQEFKNTKILPEQVKILQAQWENITAGTELRNLNIDWYDTMRANEILRVLAPLFLKIF